jgi:flagellar basal-body rod protein FlgC
VSFLSALRIAGSALTAQRLRTDVVASNVANMQTTRTPEGGPYRRQQVLFAAQDTSRAGLMGGGGFGGALARRLSTLPGAPALPALPPTAGAGGSAAASTPGAGVVVQSVGADGRAPKRVYEPDHPDADAEGYVDYPDIDPVTEMVDLLSASRAYEASVTVANAAKGMAVKALEIGR